MTPSDAMSGHVLLVDDDSSVRRGLARLLARMGHHVTEAASGKEALALLSANQQFELVLSDIKMPDMDGTKLLELVHDRAEGLPVILMTGTPEVETAMKAVRFHAFEYLTKPIDPERLGATVVRALGKHRSSQESVVGVAETSSGSCVGRRLGGRYRIKKLIGEGGMGAVYEATREDLADMVVAVKVLHPGFGGRRDLVQRFRREAEIVAALEHPNIVRLLDFHTEPAGPTFLVMERLRGMTLGQTLARAGPMPVTRVAFVASQVLAALSAAHSAGVIHRDLKPDNVFLTTVSGHQDIVKVVDFGIAKLLGATGEQLTETGLVLGTPPYMAPEYARGGHIDERADIYAVGCVSYECLCGRPPFSAENYNALLFAIQEQDPEPLRKLCPDVPARFAQLIEKAMARRVEDRFSTARGMADALKPWISADAFPGIDACEDPPIGSAPTVLADSVTDAKCR